MIKRPYGPLAATCSSPQRFHLSMEVAKFSGGVLGFSQLTQAWLARASLLLLLLMGGRGREED